MILTPEYIAAAVALAAIAFVLSALHSTSSRRRREAERRQWQSELRGRGA